MRTLLKILLGTIALMVMSVLGLALWSAHDKGQDATARCAILRNSLYAKIDQAKEIRVIEHSSRWDYANPDDIDQPEKIYATVVLNPSQKMHLKEALTLSKDRSGNTSLACIFEPHHRIEIVSPDNSTFKIEICLICGELDLGWGQRILPDGWDVSLKAFISSLSMRPDGPWRIGEKSGATSK